MLSEILLFIFRSEILAEFLNQQLFNSLIHNPNMYKGLSRAQLSYDYLHTNS